ncbi:MAG TPA: YbaB/EbfC family nucleoid-associated protein [Euzebya sp.]|nr:YbaB/EbfC family nucleoid-associated protein [Euzebya sp.]
MGNQQAMMRQAQAMMKKMQKAQEELAAREVTGSAGGGMVQAVVNGAGEFLSITINPDAVDPEDVEMLQDMVVAACNEAVRASKELEGELMGGIAGGMGLPPGLL